MIMFHIKAFPSFPMCFTEKWQEIITIYIWWCDYFFTYSYAGGKQILIVSVRMFVYEPKGQNKCVKFYWIRIIKEWMIILSCNFKMSLVCDTLVSGTKPKLIL